MENLKGVDNLATRFNIGICDYCHEKHDVDFLGYVPSYDAVVCYTCYEDNHE